MGTILARRRLENLSVSDLYAEMLAWYVLIRDNSWSYKEQPAICLEYLQIMHHVAQNDATKFMCSELLEKVKKAVDNT